MATRDALEHRRRVLEHQAKLAGEPRPGAELPHDAQLKIPLVGEARLSDGVRPPKRRRRQGQKRAQPEL
jgi:hypothetical protein